MFYLLIKVCVNKGLISIKSIFRTLKIRTWRCRVRILPCARNDYFFFLHLCLFIRLFLAGMPFSSLSVRLRLVLFLPILTGHSILYPEGQKYNFHIVCKLHYDSANANARMIRMVHSMNKSNELAAIRRHIEFTFCRHLAQNGKFYVFKHQFYFFKLIISCQCQ